MPLNWYFSGQQLIYDKSLYKKTRAEISEWDL